MGKIRDFFNVWLNPQSEENTLEEAIKKYHIAPEAAQQLLKTANGIAWTGYDEKEDIKKGLKRVLKSEEKENFQSKGNITKNRDNQEKER